ncbi:hypothetical protein [Hymenobacter terrenus]|uniref:hypothetical protein n=1 Tax=Hymenobacter terrenus TaxID=1629124 RepID=UPI000619CED7|nr:hypothetical protein [Hymenobacter terrenus]
MERSKIVFQASVDFGVHCTFDLEITSPQVKTYLSFYGQINEFVEFGQQLMAFPRSVAHTVSFEVGSADKASAMAYLLISAYCTDPQGHAALRFIVDNREQGAAYHCFEFSIASEAASINKLGALLADWNVSDTPEIIWKAETR